MRSASDIRNFLLSHSEAKHHVRLEVVPHKPAKPGTASEIADSLVKSFGFNPIGLRSWQVLGPESAAALAKQLAWRGLAYGTELMPEKTAAHIAARLVESLVPYSASFASSGKIEGDFKTWNPIGSATLEMALIGHDGASSFLLYASDED